MTTTFRPRLAHPREGLVESAMALGLLRLGFETDHVDTRHGLLRVFRRPGSAVQERAERPAAARPTLLCLHGLGSSAGPLGAIAAGLDVDAIVPDLFDGSGGSARRTTPLGHAPLTPREHAEALGDLLLTLDRPGVHLLGISLGGWIGLELAAASKAIESLFLVAPAGLETQLGRLHDVAKRTAMAGFEATYETFVGRGGALGAPLVRALARRMVESRFRAAGADRLATRLGAADCIDDRLDDVTCPTRIVVGDRDELLGCEGARELLRRLPNAEGIVLRGVSHEVLSEAYVNVHLGLRSWLRLRGEPHGAMARLRLATGTKREERPLEGHRP